VSDVLQPNVLVIGDDGSIGADFTGHVHAEGLDLDAGTSSTPPDADRVRWLRTPTGAVVAELYGWRAAVGLGQMATLELRARDNAGTNADGAQALLEAVGTGSEAASVTASMRNGFGGSVIAAAVDALGNTSQRKVVGSDGSSDFQRSAVARLGAPKGINAFTNEFTLWTQAIAGGTLNAAGLMRVSTIWSLANATAGSGNVTVRVKFGGVTFTTAQTTNQAAGSTLVFTLVFTFYNRNATNSNIGRSVTDAPLASTSAALGVTAVQTIDTSVDQNLVLTAQNSVNSTNFTTTLHQAVVEAI